MDCCGKADEHQLKPEQITRGPNDEYIVSFEGYTFVIPADKALPSNVSGQEDRTIAALALGLLLPPVVQLSPQQRYALCMGKLVGIGDPLLACVEQRNDIEARQQNAVVSSHGIDELPVKFWL